MFFASPSNVYYHYLKQVVEPEHWTAFRDIEGYSFGLAVSTCGHSLHYDCAAKMMKRSPGKRCCPICNTLFLSLMPPARCLLSPDVHTKPALALHAKEFIDTLVHKYDEVARCVPEEEDTELAPEDVLDILACIMSYNAYMSDVRGTGPMLAKSEIFQSIFYSAKLIIAEDLAAMQALYWDKVADTLIESTLKEFFAEHQGDFISYPFLPKWVHIMTLLKLRESTEPVVRARLDELCLLFLYMHLWQCIIKLLFQTCGRVFEESQLRNTCSESFFKTFIALYSPELKRISLLLLSKALTARWVLFSEPHIEALLNAFNGSYEPMSLFDRVVLELKGESVLRWLEDPGSTISFPASGLDRYCRLPLVLSSTAQSLSTSSNCDLVSMPVGLEVLGSQHRFKLLGLYDRFTELEQIHYKRRCEKCQKVKKYNVLCLLCGDILCLTGKCCLYDNNVRELTHHSQLCGKGQGLYLYFAQNKVIVVYGNKAIQVPSIYVNQHGEGVNLSLEKCFDRLHLSAGAVEELLALYCNDRIPQTVTYQHKIDENIIDLDV